MAKLQAELEIQLESQGQFDVSWLNNKQGELNAELENIGAEIISLDNSETTRVEEALRSELNSVNQEIEKINNTRRQIEKLETEKTIYFKQVSKLEAVLEANLEVQGQFDVSWLNNKNEELNTELIKLKEEITGLKADNKRETEQAHEQKLNSIQDNLNRLNKELETLNRDLKKSGQNEGQNEAISKLIDDFETT